MYTAGPHLDIMAECAICVIIPGLEACTIHCCNLAAKIARISSYTCNGFVDLLKLAPVKKALVSVL